MSSTVLKIRDIILNERENLEVEKIYKEFSINLDSEDTSELYKLCNNMNFSSKKEADFYIRKFNIKMFEKHKPTKNDECLKD